MAYMDQSKTDDWATPIDYWTILNDLYKFDVDAAASQSNKLCEKWFGLDHHDPLRTDGLKSEWDGNEIWINPPYGRIIGEWIAKAHIESNSKNITMLLPSRTDTKWFHSLLNQDGISIEFIKGRLKFGNSKVAAPFASILVRFEK
jgi:site-specific DNA-methyltransferase (adenine-specific)